MEVDLSTGWQLARAGDYGYPATQTHEPSDDLGQLTLHPAHRADVVRDDRDLARGGSTPTLPHPPGGGLLVGDRSHDLNLHTWATRPFDAPPLL